MDAIPPLIKPIKYETVVPLLFICMLFASFFMPQIYFGHADMICFHLCPKDEILYAKHIFYAIKTSLYTGVRKYRKAKI